MKKRLIALLMCASLVFAAGCGAEKSDPSASPSQAAQSSSAAKDPSGDKLITIGFSQVGAESDWRVANTASMKSAL
ncbi:MAG TPA: LacI family transcriptional regulator, partial [Ruminiclostridium sp.]|nr:LacI family transcriptional regulator [Ruminiclostridium sp.]